MQKSGYAEIRRINLKRIIEEKFEGNQAAFARALNVQASQVSNMLHGNAPIGDSMAHRIENIAKWSRGNLDNPPDKIITAYTYVSIPAHKAMELLEMLREYECIKETAMVYGNDMEAFVKLEGTENIIQNIIMQVISSHKGVRGTRTFLAMDGFHWQREQPAQNSTVASETAESSQLPAVLDDDFDFYVDELRNRLGFSPQEPKNLFITSHINQMIDDLQNMGGMVERAFQGQITITKEDKLVLYPIHLLENIQSCLYATVVWTQRSVKEMDLVHQYFEEQKVTIKQKNIAIYKIFILLNHTVVDEDDELLKQMYREMQIDVNVSYLTETDWKSGETNTNCSEEFGIFDEKQVWVYKPLINPQTMRQSVLYNNPTMVNKYLNLFNANKLTAKPLSPEQIARAEKFTGE